MMVIESLLTLGLGALMTIDAFLLQRIIIVVQQQDWAQFQTLLLIVILFVCIQAGVYFCRQYYTEHVANTSLRSLRESMVGRIAARPLAQASRNTSELLFSTLTSQLDQIKTNLIDVVLYGIMLLSQASFALIAILTLNPTLALVALALCVPMMLVPLLFRPRIEEARATVVNATNVLNSVIGDSLRGMVDWRVAGREHQIRSWLRSPSTISSVMCSSSASGWQEA